MKTIIAIDPGASGGFAIMQSDGSVIAKKMPDTEGAILDTLEGFIETATEGVVCHMEQVGGFIGGQGQPGSRMFEFGHGVGFLHGIIATNRIRLELVTPQKWQKALGLGSISQFYPANYKTLDEAAAKTARANAKRDWKNKLKSLAERLYPSVKVTLATADAILILEYAVRSQRGENQNHADRRPERNQTDSATGQQQSLSI
jgi:hypothetical protein